MGLENGQPKADPQNRKIVHALWPLAALGIVVAAIFVFGNRYESRISQRGVLYVTDRFTGSVRGCAGDECWVVRDREELDFSGLKPLPATR